MIPEINFSLLIIQGVIFLLVLFLLNKTLFKPILRILHEREERTEGFFRKSEEIGKRAKETLEKYKERIQLAKKESLELKRKYVSEGNEEKENILNKAREETNKYLESIRDKIETLASSSYAKHYTKVFSAYSNISRRLRWCKKRYGLTRRNALLLYLAYFTTMKEKMVR